MSHSKKKYPNCLNCAKEMDETEVYCSHCGQKNEELKMSFGHLFSEFLENTLHFEGKVWNTLKNLLFKPGFLTAEFNRGRRIRYVNPVRLYIFISAIFFILFNLTVGNSFEPDNLTLQDAASDGEIEFHFGFSEDDKEKKADSSNLKFKSNMKFKNSLNDSTRKFKIGKAFLKREEVDILANLHGHEVDTFYENRKLKGGLWARTFYPNVARLLNKDGSGITSLLSTFIHSIPKIMFIILPLFALILFLINIRHKPYYIECFIFALHYHSFLFTCFIILTLLGLVVNVSAWVYLISFILFLVYLHKAFKRIFHANWLKAFSKTLLFCMMYGVIIMFSFSLLFTFSLVNIH
jgi:hypothetical protein